MIQLITALAPLVADLAKRLLPNDPDAENKAKLALLQAQQSGTLAELQVSMGAILAEAQSADPWTSRARPTFLYLMYAVIVLAFVGGIVGIWAPDQVGKAADNIGKLLAAIPDSLWWLFGAGYLGYTGARSFDKWRGTSP
jgi:hypothetical protein